MNTLIEHTREYIERELSERATRHVMQPRPFMIRENPASSYVETRSVLYISQGGEAWPEPFERAVHMIADESACLASDAEISRRLATDAKV
jgi:hypothetical protein